MRTLTWIGAWLLPALPAAAAVHQVPGSFSTIGAALAAANPGDVIEVAAGTYAPSTNGETYPLTVTKDNLVLQGAGMGLTILDAEGTSRVVNWEASTGGRVTGFTIRGGLADTGGGLRVGNGAPEVDGNLFVDNGAGVRGAAIYVIRQALPTATPWIHHNVMWNNYDSTPADAVDTHGVIHSGESAGIFEHNLVGRTDGNGLLTATNAAPIVRHNIFVENGIPGPPPRGRGICWLSTPPATMSHNLFHGNTIAAILWPASAGSNFSGAAANDVDSTDGVFGNLDGAPLLADPDAFDFHLTALSPAIDAGDPTLPFDPDGTVADLGPFYFDQGGVSDAPVVDARGGAIALRAGPNPFRESTVLAYARPAGARDALDVRIVDAAGRVVRRLPPGTDDAGRIAWDGRDDSGRGVASGVYLFVVRAGGEVRSVPVVRLR